MTTIVEFLTARLDEDEEVAIVAARGAAYQTGDEAPEWSLRSPLALWSAPHGHAFGNVSPMAIRAATHIARHDPARVLREVEAKRAIVALHGISSFPEKWGDVRHHPDQNWPRTNYVGQLTGETVYSCATCDFDPEDGDGPIKRALSGCETLLALAAVYADHPDYEQSWSVE